MLTINIHINIIHFYVNLSSHQNEFIIEKNMNN